jgi:fucose permease
MIGPLISGAIVNFLGSWRLGFQVFSLLVAVTIIPILTVPTGLPPPSRRRPLEGAMMVIRSKVILFLSLATFLQLAAEYGIGMWLVYFFLDFRGFTVMESSIILGSMGGTFIPGRLFWSKYVDRIGYVNTLGLCAVLSSTLLAISLLSPSLTLTMIIFPAASFFISATIPAGLAMAVSEFPKASGAAIGALYLSGAVGGALGPFTVGAVSEASTTLLGILTIPLFLAIITVVALGLRSAGVKKYVELPSPPVKGVE